MPLNMQTNKCPGTDASYEASDLEEEGWVNNWKLIIEKPITRIKTHTI